jgi:hypothetical protein
MAAVEYLIKPENHRRKYMRIGKTSMGLMALCLAVAGCNAQDTDSPAAGEDQGQFPDTTATDANMITPSDDAGMASDTAVTGTAATAGTSTGAATQ